MLRDYNTNLVVMDPFYPVIKYEMPADLKIDETNSVIVVESMSLNLYSIGLNLNLAIEWLSFSLSFTCENDQKAFYKLIKDCLQFRIHEESCVIFVNNTGSA